MSDEQRLNLEVQISELISKLDRQESGIKAWLPHVVSVFAIIASMFTGYKFYESRLQKIIKTETISYVNSNEFKEVFKTATVEVLENSKVKNKVFQIVDDDIRTKGIIEKINNNTSHLQTSLIREINKQISKIEKDSDDIKIEDIEFCINMWEKTKEKKPSIAIQINRLKQFMENK